jgi:hypothetical protein
MDDPHINLNPLERALMALYRWVGARGVVVWAVTRHWLVPTKRCMQRSAPLARRGAGDGSELQTWFAQPGNSTYAVQS